MVGDRCGKQLRGCFSQETSTAWAWWWYLGSKNRKKEELVMRQNIAMRKPHEEIITEKYLLRRQTFTSPPIANSNKQLRVSAQRRLYGHSSLTQPLLQRTPSRLLLWQHRTFLEHHSYHQTPKEFPDKPATFCFHPATLTAAPEPNLLQSSCTLPSCYTLFW